MSNTILRINVDDKTCDDIRVEVYSDGGVVMVDCDGDIVSFSHVSAIEAARAILKHFGEGLE